VDAKFHPAIAAIKAGDTAGLKSLIDQDPTLATGRSSMSHPTLLQCLVLEALDIPNRIEMAKVLLDAGAEINGPLVACASIDNVDAAAFLLDCGALINGAGSWSPLEEALYWKSNRVRDLLLDRGASIHNLRIAAGLGRTDLIEGFFDDRDLKPEAGRINWPFVDPLESNLPRNSEQQLQATINERSHNSRNVINNAFIYACMHNQLDAAELLLQKGAEINAIPLGFHYRGTGLHNAAVNGHREMVEFLIEQGADPAVTDPQNNGTPAGWAAYGGHQELSEYLKRMAIA
jgi:uncharacterized protein